MPNRQWTPRPVTRCACIRSFAAPTLVCLTVLLAAAGGAATGATLSSPTRSDPMEAHAWSAPRAGGPARPPGPAVRPDPVAPLLVARPLEAMLWSVICPQGPSGQDMRCIAGRAPAIGSGPSVSPPAALSHTVATSLAAVALALFWAGAFRSR